MSDTFDQSSTLHIDGEVLNRSSFKKTSTEKLARRVGNEADAPLFVSDVGAGGGATPILVYGDISALVAGALTTIATYTVPVGKTLGLKKVEVSGGNIAKYQVEIDAVVQEVRRTYWGNFNSDFNLNGFKVLAGSIIRVRVIHNRTAIVSDFDATITGDLT